MLFTRHLQLSWGPWAMHLINISFRATHVPVGDDQKQHLEFARECVTNFNHNFGPLLVSPETITCEFVWPSFVSHLSPEHSFLTRRSPDTPGHVVTTTNPEDVEIH